MLELITLMVLPKVSTRKVTLDGGITKFQNEKLTTLASEKRLFQRWYVYHFFLFLLCMLLLQQLCGRWHPIGSCLWGLTPSKNQSIQIWLYFHFIGLSHLTSVLLQLKREEEEGMSFTANYTRRRGPFSSQKSFEKIHKKEKDLVWLLKGFFGFCMRSFMRLGFVEK